MGYLPVAIPPLPEFVAFVPVDSVEAATKLVEKAPVVIRKEDEEGRYEVIGPNRTFPIVMKNGYAFVPLGNNPDAKILDREFPDPSQLLAGQAQQFDASVRLDVESIPVATRTLLYGLINSGISTQLQQRDGEPEGAYRIRRVEGERGLAALKMLFMDCQKLTFGVDISEEEQSVNIDFIVDAIKGSQMLKEIFSSTDRPSQFIPLLDDNAAVSLSMSTMMADREKEAYGEMMEGFRMEVARLIEENSLGPAPDENSPIGQALFRNSENAAGRPHGRVCSVLSGFRWQTGHRLGWSRAGRRRNQFRRHGPAHTTQGHRSSEAGRRNADWCRRTSGRDVPPTQIRYSTRRSHRRLW
ncbi:MAG UNVERIFIED_CONTAM: hypothetical protein LVR18_32720 [Planctomycetaceae bacterium]|jgi:hypothetical protein